MVDASGSHTEPGGRFRLHDKSLKDSGHWFWQRNPFVGMRPYQLKMGALLTGAGSLVAIAAGWLLGAGRFRSRRAVCVRSNQIGAECPQLESLARDGYERNPRQPSDAYGTA